jgi:hypothetical protein
MTGKRTGFTVSTGLYPLKPNFLGIATGMFFEKIFGVHWFIDVRTDSKTLLLNKFSVPIF